MLYIVVCFKHTLAFRIFKSWISSCKFYKQHLKVAFLSLIASLGQAGKAFGQSGGAVHRSTCTPTSFFPLFHKRSRSLVESQCSLSEWVTCRNLLGKGRRWNVALVDQLSRWEGCWLCDKLGPTEADRRSWETASEFLTIQNDKLLLHSLMMTN